jgi:nitroimidazol reductase NimA-like FMN-containing flavoprotein (pyridoxamine 5'-phosphate oxidase superfamily)
MDSAVANHSEMIELDTERCRSLLFSHSFGRVSFVDQQGIALFPVNYVFDGEALAIRSDIGSRLHHAVQSEVAFEIDHTYEQTRMGWSVLVIGTAYDVSDSVDGASVDVRSLPVDTWAPGAKKCWIRIEPRSITGRMVRPA